MLWPKKKDNEKKSVKTRWLVIVILNGIMPTILLKQVNKNIM